jgi:hypothetical protein
MVIQQTLSKFRLFFSGQPFFVESAFEKGD